mmetsp:Transcript_26941/g.72311  ORF Transcript_26941/g.72311 Transcript_26941/m.72311 type:complete len:305 (+) Transcript_26941:137-1051(+)
MRCGAMCRVVLCCTVLCWPQCNLYNFLIHLYTISSQPLCQHPNPSPPPKVTIQLWMCDLVKANALYECCVVAAHSGIHPGLVRDDAGKSLLFKVVSPEAADLFTRDFDAQDPNPSFAQVSTEIFSEAGMSCLHYVRSSAIAEALVRAGANVNKRNNGRSTALFYAEHPALVKTLLRLGSDPAMVNIHNHTPAYLAASHGYWDVVFFLLKAGARANATVSATGLQPPGGVPDPLVLIDRLLAGVPVRTSLLDSSFLPSLAPPAEDFPPPLSSECQPHYLNNATNATHLQDSGRAPELPDQPRGDR